MCRRLAPVFGLVAGLALAIFPALAQAQVNIDQGKSPAEIYSSDCATCHKTPRGLAAGKNSLMLSAFLREHYTASRDQAAALAAYVLGAGGAEPAPKQKPDVEHARAEEPKAGEPKTAAHPVRASAKPEEEQAAETGRSQARGPSGKPGEQGKARRNAGNGKPGRQAGAGKRDARYARACAGRGSARHERDPSCCRAAKPGNKPRTHSDCKCCDPGGRAAERRCDRAARQNPGLRSGRAIRSALFGRRRSFGRFRVLIFVRCFAGSGLEEFLRRDDRGFGFRRLAYLRHVLAARNASCLVLVAGDNDR